MPWTRQAEMMGHVLRIQALCSPLWDKPGGGTRWGQYDVDRQTIQLNESPTEALQKLTAIHELTHAADALFGLRLSEARTDQVAIVMHGMLVHSPAVVRWLVDAEEGAVVDAMPLQLLSTKLLVLAEGSNLWRGNPVRVSLEQGTVLVDPTAGEHRQRLAFVGAVLQTGLDLLDVGVRRSTIRSLAEAWLSVIRNSPELMVWLTEAIHEP